jgi:N-acyl-D-aspartate/D-glutamate deacylase
MTFDLKITGGMVVDGTGAPPRRADVGVRDGLIVEVGACDAPATRVIDASGHIVTPGFVDLHTHYDGQVSWDPDLAPSVFHGVTTLVMGNCGVGFAPVRAQDRNRLIELMEGVEDIPGTALHEGIRWTWETFAEYLDALEASPRTLDVLAQVPHDALRVYAMGDRAAVGQPATEADIAVMRAELRSALEAGAAGFSTGRSDNHRDPRGGETPAAEATAAELCGIAQAFVGLKHGVLSAVSDFDLTRGRDRFDAEFDLLERMVEASGGHRFSLSLIQRIQDSEQWRRIVARSEAANTRGLTMRLQVGARGIGVLLGLTATFHPFMGFPSYKAIVRLPLPERVRRMRDPEFKARMLAETSEKVSGDGSAIPPLADELLSNLDFVAMRLWRFSEGFSYEPGLQDSVLAAAYANGQTTLSRLYDELLEDDGKALLYFPIYNYLSNDLSVVAEMLAHPLALPGLSDGGAHAGTICDASFPTFMLTCWARDRAQGQLPLERVVQMLTADGADHMGLRDRGRIVPGLRADLNVIDHAGLSISRPRMVEDLPAGGRRLLQDASGYRATIVAGVPVVEHDALTGARPGRLVRMGRG